MNGANLVPHDLCRRLRLDGVRPAADVDRGRFDGEEGDMRRGNLCPDPVRERLFQVLEGK